MTNYFVFTFIVIACFIQNTYVFSYRWDIARNINVREGGAQWDKGHSRLFWFIWFIENVEF